MQNERFFVFVNDDGELKDDWVNEYIVEKAHSEAKEKGWDFYKVGKPYQVKSVGGRPIFRKVEVIKI
jgi:hypothetical protein